MKLRKKTQKMFDKRLKNLQRNLRVCQKMIRGEAKTSHEKEHYRAVALETQARMEELEWIYGELTESKVYR